VKEASLDMKQQPSNPANFTKAHPRALGHPQVVYFKALRHLGRNYSYDFMQQLGERVRDIAAMEADLSVPNSTRSSQVE